MNILCCFFLHIEHLLLVKEVDLGKGGFTLMAWLIKVFKRAFRFLAVGGENDCMASVCIENMQIKIYNK